MTEENAWLWTAVAAGALGLIWIVPLIAAVRRCRARPAGWGPLLAAGACGCVGAAALGLAPLFQGETVEATYGWMFAQLGGVVAAQGFLLWGLVRGWRSVDAAETAAPDQPEGATP